MQLTKSIIKVSNNVPGSLIIPMKSIVWFPSYIRESLKKLNNSGRGKIILTFDVETANDFIHWMNLDLANHLGHLSRKALINVKKLAEAYHIPMTWHCTGHSLLEGCKGHNTRIFKWATKEKGFDNFWATHDWFYFDPKTNVDEAPEWYFGDLIQEITNSDVKHEISSHTFSHIRCDLASKEEFILDMQWLQKVFQEQNLKLVSHAYPWNIVGFLDLLPQFGIHVCRLETGFIPSKITGVDEKGITLVYESLAGTPLYPAFIKFGIDVAIKKKAIFVWLLHLQNVYRRSDLQIFMKILDYVSRCVKKSLLTATTLSDCQMEK